MVLNVSGKKNWLIVICTGLWLIGWISILLTLIYGFISDPQKIDDTLLLILVAYILAGGFILRVFLWNLRGKEMISLDRNILRIDKKGIFFTIPKIIDLKDVESIAISEKQITPFIIRLSGFGGGQIHVSYLGQNRYFGQYLTLEEALRLIDLIKEKINATIS